MQQMLDTGRINARHHCYVQRHHRINAMLEPQGYAVQCNKGHATSFVAQMPTQEAKVCVGGDKQFPSGRHSTCTAFPSHECRGREHAAPIP